MSTDRHPLPPADRLNPQVLRRLWTFGAGHRRTLVLAFLCMVALGFTTGALAYLTGPALQFLLTGGAEGRGWMTSLAPALGFIDRERALWVLPAVVVLVGALKGLAYLGQFYWMGLFGQCLVIQLRRAVFEKLLQLSSFDVSRRKTGELLARFSSDVAAVELAATYTVGSYVRDGIQLFVLTGVAFAVSWKLALGSLLLVPAAAWPVSRITRAVLGRTRQGQHQLGRMAAQVQEGLAGIRAIQAFNGQAAELLRLEHQTRVHREAVTRAGWLRGAVPSLMEVFAAGAVALVLAFAAWSQAVPPAQLISFVMALVLVYQPAKELGRVTQFAIQAVVAGERIFELLDIPPAVDDRPAAVSAPVAQKSIRLLDAHFAYGDRKALTGLSLEIPIGRVTALVGPSGGGKSTVTSLLLRFARVHEGRLELDGCDIEAFTARSLRKQFALVSQEPLLFSDTVLENLRLSRPSATVDEVVDAARVADADAFIRELPRGYHTPIGERGLVLSGGQKQRLCLARAVLSQAPVLILDEPTSNLDPHSEREVAKAMAQVSVGRTVLVIAHRLASVTQADLIHVVEAGRVIESGTHRSLLERGGAYARLWSLQSGPSTEAA